MASVVDICNKALSLLGQKPIVSLDDDSPEAFACRTHWVPLRDEVLRGHPWNCVSKRAVLSKLLDTPPFGYAYYYQLPSDCLFVARTDPEENYEVEGRKLLTNSTSMNIVYLKKEDDSTVYDPQLSAAFTFLLASELAPQMTSSSSEAERLLKIGEKKLSAAQASDAMESRRPDRRPSRWISAKHG